MALRMDGDTFYIDHELSDGSNTHVLLDAKQISLCSKISISFK